MNEYLGKIKRAYDLSRDVDKQEGRVNTIEHETYPERSPKEPVKQIARYVAPEKPESTLKFPWKPKLIIIVGLMVLMMVLSAITGLTRSTFLNIVSTLLATADWVYFLYVLYERFSKFPKQKKADVERMIATPEFQAKINHQKEVQQEQQREYDVQYEKAVTQYKVDLAEYKKAYEAFEQNRKEQLLEARSQLTELQGKFRLACDEIGALPYKYRNTEALAYIHGVIESSSSMTVKEAIESYDRHVQQEIDRQRLEEERYQSKLAEQRLAEAERAADAQEEYNNIAERAARQQNMWNTVQAFQSHKQNKILSQMNKRAEEAEKRRNRRR